MQFSMFQFSFINLSGLEGICDGVMKKIFWHHPEITLFLGLANYALHSLDRTV